ncbi:MAG TPA: pseudaminic acid synthase [Candidatus Omnitrophica bacterium]|nr:pseudaminic acid synthase [Candidatus Omnitrophota bacterium]
MSEIKSFKIEKHTIGPSYEPFIIAEMSGNHNGSLEKALAIVDAAAAAGAHALKIQTYTADTMTLDLKQGEFLISDPNSLWTGKTLYELYREASTPWEWHKPIFDRCREKGIIGFSTPFDATAVDFLEKLNVPCYKVASFENTDLELIRKVARTGKPVIISTGMADLEEIEDAVRVLKEEKCSRYILLKCTSIYPSVAEEANLSTIPDMIKRFGCPVGLSDHTLGTAVAVASAALGACVVEKHFILSRKDEGVDSAFSLEPEELRRLVDETRAAWKAVGRVQYQPSPREEKSKQFRRTLYVVRDIKKGEKLTCENIRAIRPGLGLPIKHWSKVMTGVAACDLKRGTGLQLEHIA